MRPQDSLKRLLVWLGRLLYKRLKPIHDRLDYKWASDPRLRGRLWRMAHVPEWQKSTAVSITFWLLATAAVYKLSPYWHRGWLLNLTASLVSDVCVYVVSKLWIWEKRQTPIPTSISRWVMVWLGSFVTNFGLGWVLIERFNLPALGARGILAVVGILLNPVIFWLRDKLIFPWRRSKAHEA